MPRLPNVGYQSSKDGIRIGARRRAERQRRTKAADCQDLQRDAYDQCAVGKRQQAKTREAIAAKSLSSIGLIPV